MTEQRVAIVTGSAQGIGAAIARELAGDGVKVAVADLNILGAQRVAEDIGGAAKALDISDPDQVSQVVSEVVTEYGRIDILVNNAGLVPFTPWDQLDFTEWKRVFDTNVNGLFLMTKAVCAPMADRGSSDYHDNRECDRLCVGDCQYRGEGTDNSWTGIVCFPVC